MNELETQTLMKLVEAHNLFLQLPVQHPDDLPEWIRAIHELQRIVASREAVRNNTDVFYNANGINN